MEPKVTLLTHTNLPLETVYSVWQASKNEQPLMTPEEVWMKREREPAFDAEVRDLFRAVIAQRIPVGEHVDFVFMFENISIAWREQAVRHRIGVLPSPERVGADMVMDVVPNLADSSWWSQSMRIQDMGKFADNMAYRVPDKVKSDPMLLAKWQTSMWAIQDMYNTFVREGVPIEDARDLIPLGAQHRMSWKLNIGSLQHIVGKRGCWILQLGLWKPIILGMISELTQKVDPIFGELVTPPCLTGDDFKGCVYMEENRRRYTGDDCHAPCSLHVRKHYLPALLEEGGGTLPTRLNGGNLANVEVDEDMADKLARSARWLEVAGVPRPDELISRAEEYRTFWGRDPFTGKRLRVLP